MIEEDGDNHSKHGKGIQHRALNDDAQNGDDIGNVKRYPLATVLDAAASLRKLSPDFEDDQACGEDVLSGVNREWYHI